MVQIHSPPTLQNRLSFRMFTHCTVLFEASLTTENRSRRTLLQRVRVQASRRAMIGSTLVARRAGM